MFYKALSFKKEKSMDTKVILDVVSYFCNKNTPLGKPQLQKLIYLLKEKK